MHIDMKHYTALLLVLLMACTRTTDAPQRLREKVDWQGHRGARGLAPENTLAAMFRALELGVTTLELDVVVSADSQLVLSHEPWFSPEICLDSAGKPFADSARLPIRQFTAAQIRAFDCGTRPHPRFPGQVLGRAYKPTLAEVVTAVRTRCQAEGWPEPYYNIETKHTPEWEAQGLVPSAELFTRILVGEINRLEIRSSSTLQSFNPATLQAAAQMNAGISLCLLVENTDGPEANLERLGFYPTHYSPYFELVDAELVSFCHAKGIQVVPWTVNEVADMRRLLSLGVDGLISDYPDRYTQLPEFEPYRLPSRR